MSTLVDVENQIDCGHLHVVDNSEKEVDNQHDISTDNSNRALLDEIYRVGFHVLQLPTQWSPDFTQFPTIANDLFMNSVAMNSIISRVNSTFSAAEMIALSATTISRTATMLRYYGLSGDGEVDNNPVIQYLKSLSPSNVTEYSNALAVLSILLNNFIAPIEGLSNNEIRKAVLTFSLLQEQHRPPLWILSTSLHPTIDYELGRCMAYSCACYGTLAMNFLDFIPRGMCVFDVFAALVPGVQPQDIVKSQFFVTGIGSPGYVLLIDHSRSCVVLAVRGSLHLADILTDLKCEHMPCNTSLFQDSPAYREFTTPSQAHEGFLLSANSLDVDLREDVDSLLKKFPSYGLLLCGHSLGAAVASLLCIKWSQYFPQVRCVALATPCVLTVEAARVVSDRVTSVIIGDDVICRLSLGTCSDLRDACLRIYHEIVSKTEGIGSSGDCEGMVEGKKVSTDGEKVDFHLLMNEIRREQMQHPKLYPPGKLIHLVSLKEWKRQSDEECILSSFTNVQGSGDDLTEEVGYVADQLAFSEIIISSDMFSVHFPQYYLKKIREHFPLSV